MEERGTILGELALTPAKFGLQWAAHCKAAGHFILAPQTQATATRRFSQPSCLSCIIRSDLVNLQLADQELTSRKPIAGADLFIQHGCPPGPPEDVSLITNPGQNPPSPPLHFRLSRSFSSTASIQSAATSSGTNNGNANRDPNRATHFGFETVTEAEKVERVAGVFTSVAESYDRMNDLMSFGWHRIWKYVQQSSPRALSFSRLTSSGAR